MQINAERLTFKRTQPAFFNIAHAGLPNDHETLRWGWVYLEETVSCLNYILAEQRTDMPPIGMLSIFERYGLLCGMKNGKPLFTWSHDRCLTISEETMPPSSKLDEVFIPAGWAKRILAVAKTGIIQVTSQLLPQGHENEYQLIGRHWNGSNVVVCVRGYCEHGITTADAPNLTIVTP